MTTALERASQLIALAMGPTTPSEEARSAAMAAVRLIARERLIGDRGFFDVQPREHCPGCRCYSNEDYGRYRPRTDDVFREPVNAEKKRYGEGWERIWGASGRPSAAAPGACTCSFTIVDRISGSVTHNPGCPAA